MKLRYSYTNQLGRIKIININLDSKDENGEYEITIWDMATGEFCGSGRNSLQTLIDFLDNYRVKHPELTALAEGE